MADLVTAVEEQLSKLGQYLMAVDMFPVFFGANFLIACVMIREDSDSPGTKFRQNHPLTSWLCTILAGLSGLFVWNFLFGQPLVEAVKENTLVIFITVEWYLINYSPSDVVYKIATFSPIILSAAALQECLRVRFIYLGILQVSKTYPGAYIIILLAGVINGNGYGLIKIVENLVRGKWSPTTNELLHISYFSKSGLYAGVLFLLHHVKLLPVPIELLYLGVAVTFIVFRLLLAVGGVKDPLLPFESPVCSLLFGSSSEENEVNATEIKDKKSK